MATPDPQRQSNRVGTPPPAAGFSTSGIASLAVTHGQSAQSWQMSLPTNPVNCQ